MVLHFQLAICNKISYFSKMTKAIVIGATGATGTELVAQLLHDSRFDEVLVFVRRPFFGANAKLTEVVVDFDKLNDHAALIRGHVVFSCLGTTLKDAGGKDAQWRVDHDYQLDFAKIAKENGVDAFVLLSAIGADPESFFFYSKMKGTLEQNIRQLRFGKLIILQPGAIDRPGSTRRGEKIGIRLIKALNAVGLFKNYAPVTTSQLAKAMIASFFADRSEYKIVSLDEIGKLSD